MSKQKNEVMMPFDLSNLPTAPTNAPNPEEMLQVNAFHPYVQLLQGQSSWVKDPKSECKAGQFVMPRGGKDVDQLVNFGMSFEALPVAYRFKAVDFSGDTPVVYLDPESEEFKFVHEKAKARKQDYNSGIELLLWIDGEETFATMDCTSKTMAQFAVKDVIPHLKTPRLIKSVFIDPDKSKHSWYGAKGFESQSIPQKLPEMDTIMKVVDAFLNPPKDEEDEEDVPV